MLISDTMTQYYKSNKARFEITSKVSIQLPGRAITIFKWLHNHLSKLIPICLVFYLGICHALLCGRLFVRSCGLNVARQMWFERCTAHVARRHMQKTVCKSAIARYFISASDHAPLCGRLCLSASWACYIYHLHTWTPTYVPTYTPEHLHTYVHTWTPEHLSTYLHTYLPACLLSTCLPTLLAHVVLSLVLSLILFVQKMIKDVQKDVQRCSKKFIDVQRSSKMFKGVCWSPLEQGRPSLSRLATWLWRSTSVFDILQLWSTCWWQNYIEPCVRCKIGQPKSCQLRV